MVATGDEVPACFASGWVYVHRGNSRGQSLVRWTKKSECSGPVSELGVYARKSAESKL